MFQLPLFISLVGFSILIASSAIGLKLCVITAGIKIVLLAKDKLITIKVLTS